MKPRRTHILIATAIIGMSFVALGAFALYPVIRLAISVHAAQRRVIHDLDHATIRRAAINLLATHTDGIVENDDWPRAIAESQPSSVDIQGGTVWIEYGGGFLHFGLVVDPRNALTAPYNKLCDGVFSYEME